MRLMLLLGASLLVSAGCNTGTAPRNGSALRVLLTDAPFPYDQVSRVDLYAQPGAYVLGVDLARWSVP